MSELAKVSAFVIPAIQNLKEMIRPEQTVSIVRSMGLDKRCIVLIGPPGAGKGT